MFYFQIKIYIRYYDDRKLELRTCYDMMQATLEQMDEAEYARIDSTPKNVEVAKSTSTY